MVNKYLIDDLYSMFRTRCSEVERYIEFVMIMTEHKVTGLYSIDSFGSINTLKDFKVSRELTKTLRANTYLLLYNLVEATMTTAIDSIHQAVISSGLGFNDLSRDLQNVALRHFKKAIRNGHDVALDAIHPIQMAMLQLGYDKECIFSGNVDTRQIFEMAKQYGFVSPDPNKKGRKIASKMSDIKDKRNGLAHGRLSFEECGEETSADYLKVVAKQTIVYLRAVLWSISKYLRQKKYQSIRHANVLVSAV